MRYWLAVGAQPSDRVAWLLGRIGILPTAPMRQFVQSAVPKYLREKTDVASKAKSAAPAKSSGGQGAVKSGAAATPAKKK